MIRVAVLIPSKGRAHQLAAHVANLLSQTLVYGVELIVTLAVEPGDIESFKAARRLMGTDWGERRRVQMVEREPGLTAAQAWRLAHKAADRKFAPDWFVLGADDIVWHEDWLLLALEVARKTGATVIGLNDGHTNLAEYGPHYMAHRSFVRLHLDGQFVPEGYLCWWFDREVCEIARAAKLYAPAWETWVEHMHPDWGTAEMDATYEEAWPLHDVDKALYVKRQAERQGRLEKENAS